MHLELDHLFICVQREAPEAQNLAPLGLMEGRQRRHIGQGTANVCYFFRNAMLELLWVCDEAEVRSPLVQPTKLWGCWRKTGSCPFGICFKPVDGARGPSPSRPGPMNRPTCPPACPSQWPPIASAAMNPTFRTEALIWVNIHR
jgi:hypothetical protein